MFGSDYDFYDHSTSTARLFVTQNHFSLYVLFMTDHDAIIFSTNRNESLYVHGRDGHHAWHTRLDGPREGDLNAALLLNHFTNLK